MATQDYDALKKELDALKKDVKGVTETMKGLGEKAVDAKDNLLENFSTDELKKYINSVKDKGQEGMKNINNTIKDDPFKSVGIAALVGFVIGWLMKK